MRFELTERFKRAYLKLDERQRQAVKALFQRHHLDAWGHTVSILLSNFPAKEAIPANLLTGAKILDKHYIPARYPNSFEIGAPADFYTAEEADLAIRIAGEIIDFCKNYRG